MKCHIILFAAIFVAFIAAYRAQRYCEIKSREQYVDISRAINQGSRWLTNEQEADGKWVDVHTSANVIATLKLLGYGIDDGKSCALTMTRAANFLLAANATIEKEHGGRLAYIIMGLKALCKDPSDFNGMNLLTRLMEDMKNYPKGNFNHPFQYSLGMIALAINDVKVPFTFPDLLIKKVAFILRTGAPHSKDTCAVMAMALASVYDQFEEKKTFAKSIQATFLKLAKRLRMKLHLEKDNLWTRSLVMQAQTAVNSVLDDNQILQWSQGKCESNYEKLLTQMKPDGSFGGLSANLHVLPTLVGVSYLDLKNDKSCAVTKEGPKPKAKIDVCVKIEFEAINKQNPSPQTIRTSNSTTALNALKQAASQLGNCTVETKPTSFGESIVSICGVAQNHKKKMYWMFYVDDKMASTGAGSYYPKDGECVVMKYKKLNFK